jgi:RNA polymerase sigma-70 factor (ECF subfamily)
LEINEQELIQRLKKRDINAFEAFIKYYEKKVYNTAYRLMGSREDACDISQEVFLKVYKSINTFRGNSSLSTWVYRITTNLCLDEIRKRKGVRIFSIDKPIETNEGEIYRETPDTSDTPEDIINKKEVQEFVQDAINQLPVDQKTVVVLRDIQDLSYQEIAKILDCSLGTVKSRLNRGRLALKQIIERKGELFKEFVV